MGNDREFLFEFFSCSTCSLVQNTEPYRAFFFNTIAEIFAGLVQYANVGEIARHCEQISSYNGSSLEKLAQYSRTQTSDCMGLYDEFLDEYANTNLTTKACKYFENSFLKKNFFSINFF